MFLFFNFIDRMCFGKPSVDGLMVRFDDSMFVNGALPNSLPRHRPFVGDVYGGGCALLAERSPFARHVGGWMWVGGGIDICAGWMELDVVLVNEFRSWIFRVPWFEWMEGGGTR